MNILVAVKHAIEVDQPVYLHNGRVVFDELEHGMNVWDEHAVEAALCLSEQHGAHVTVVTIGDESSLSSIHRAVAMGVGHGMHVLREAAAETDPFSTAGVLRNVVLQGRYDLVLLGNQAMDTGCGQVGMLLGDLLGWPCATNVVGLTWGGRDQVTATRRVDRGKEVHRISLPAVVSVSDELNEPRSPSLRGILQSERKPVDVLTVEQLGFTSTEVLKNCPKTRIVALQDPPERKPGRILEGDAEAVAGEMAEILFVETDVLQSLTMGTGGANENSCGD